MPIEAFLDDRLSKTDLRVLGAILSFADKKTGLCWPKREQLAERCGLSLPKISTATTSLVSLGWLEKEGDGGRSRSVHYKVITPILITKTVPNSGTVPDSETVPDSGTKTVPDSGTGIKQTNEQTNTTTTSGSVKKVKSDVKPKARISRDWQPSDRCYELITRAGIGRDFASGLIDEFILYWEERGDKRSGWEATFVNHSKNQWDRSPQKNQRLDHVNTNFKPSTGVSRKPSLVDQGLLSIARVEERERRERYDQLSVVS